MRHFYRMILGPSLCTLGLNFASHAQASNENSTISLANAAIEDHVDRFMSIINDESKPYNETEYSERFTASFVAAVPLVDGMLPIIENLQQTSDSWMIQSQVDVASVTAVVLVIAPEDTGEPQLSMQLSIDPADDDKINGFFVGPAEPGLLNPPKTVQDAVGQLGALGQNVTYLVADVGGGEGGVQCNVLAGKGVEDPAPMGSMFKLWVLAAVVDAVQEEAVRWDQLVFMTDEARSLPSGIVQNDPPGSNRTVRELAELMISISDNTATDLLMGLVGRVNVEKALEEYGHHNASLNMPFLTTKEMFLLKLDGAEGDGQPGPLGQQYLASNKTERRAILSDLENTTISSFDLDIIRAWGGGPIVVEDIEWFGSPLDLCNVLARLYNDEEAARILSLNPGIPDNDNLWSYIGYKGGSEPGVLGMAWYLVPVDDTYGHRVVTGTLWDTTQAVDETQAALLFGALRDLSILEDIEESGEIPSGLDVPGSQISESGTGTFGWIHTLLLMSLLCLTF